MLNIIILYVMFLLRCKCDKLYSEFQIKKKMMGFYEKFLERSRFILGIMVWMHIRVHSFRRDYRVHESIAVIY